MDISSFATKASLIKGGVTLSGLSSASIGGYYVYDWIHPGTGLKSFRFSGSFTFSKPKCFETLSFNADLPTNINFSSPDSLEAEFTPTVPTDTTSSGSTQGCTIMKKTNKGDTGWEFESGTLIKDDKHGIFVSFELNSASGNNSLNSRYQAYFFEKSSEKWEIKFGFISKFGGNNDYEVSTPDGSHIKIEYKNNNNTFTSSGQYNYSGKWTENNGGSEKLLFDGVFKNLSNNVSGDSLNVSYIYDGNKIKEGTEGNTSFKKGCLEKWLDLFKSKTGKWTTSSS